MTIDNIPVVPGIHPGQRAINMPRVINPYTTIWWSSQSVSGVSESVMGWLIAQGWEITGISPDNSTVPPTLYYALAKQGQEPADVLLSLCNSYTIAANEAREANQIRYNDVVTSWNNLSNSTHSHFAAQVAEQNAQAGIFIDNLDSHMDYIDGKIEENQSELVTDAEAATTALVAMDTKLTGLETLRLLKQFRSMLPCILLSARLDELMIEQARLARAFSVLAKPITLAQLTGTLRQALRRTYDWRG